MTDRDADKLRETIRTVVAKIERFKDRNLGEQNTKSTLIEPILEALGWDVRDPDEVYREYKPTSRDCPVDYALALLHDLKLFVEAKGLGGDLTDRKWIGQILGYAVVAGVEWCVLTDGDEYRFYNATAAVDAEEKIFFVIRLSSGNEDEAVKTLSLISRANLGENILNVLWKSHFVDRRVKECLRRMLETRDKGLIRLIRKRSPKLQPDEIAQSLRRLEIRIDSPKVTLDSAAKRKAQGTPRGHAAKSKGAGQKAAETRRAQAGVTLTALASSGMFVTPLRLFRKYRGTELEATLRRDGKVEFRGETYDSCSMAAGHARGTVTGKPMNTNGWEFWRFLDAQGKKRTLDEVRQQLLAQQAGQ